MPLFYLITPNLRPNVGFCHTSRRGPGRIPGGNSGDIILISDVFTVRHDKIRVISARDMNRKERKVYESHE